ncbi:MAG TPA: coproporphyrinogen III oxidase [Deltaproteobacteria bacterium]|nr:coproporphyrinogen III oxidase [Deltaproteobacteria bacterium]
MQPTPPSSALALQAQALVHDLQRQLVEALEALQPGAARFQPVEWLRDEGRHGGGVRYIAPEGGAFNRASVNVSTIHYGDLPDKKLSSATALSAIVHPAQPRAPSMHMHISWTQLRDGSGYWRMMADLNPSIEDPEAAEAFGAALAAAAPEHYAEAKAQGERYFYIPALKRHRGVSHFYLEGHDSGDWSADEALARRVGEATVRTYTGLVAAALSAHPTIDEDDRRRQLAYHTLYLFQVLTLDRGTTSGLLIHDQNDAGIMGSLPSHVDRALLASWAPRLPAPQDQLLRSLISVLPDASPCPIGPEQKLALAQAVREHYRTHPDALALQARGDALPPTVENHR